MANFRITTAARNACVDALAALVDAGASGGTIKVYTATQPAGPGTAITTQTLLGTLTFASTAFAAGASGVIAANVISDDVSADASGVATWARIADSNGVAIFDCDVTATGGGGTITFNTVTVTAGGIITMTSFSVTMPAS